jgi:hypothetical protein
MRCADDQRSYRGKRTKRKTKRPRCEYDSAFHWQAV